MHPFLCKEFSLLANILCLSSSILRSNLYFSFQPYNSGITPVENPPSFADVEKKYGIGSEPQPSCSKDPAGPYGPLQSGFARPAAPIQKLPPFSVFYDKFPALAAFEEKYGPSSNFDPNPGEESN